MAKPPKQSVHALLEELLSDHSRYSKVNVYDVKMDMTKVRGMSVVRSAADGAGTVEIYVSSEMSAEQKQDAIAREVRQLLDTVSKVAATPTALLSLLDTVVLKRESEKPDVSISSVIIPKDKVAEGILVQSVSAVWYEMVKWLEKHSDKAHEIDPTVWEHLVAGALKKDGYDEVIVTDRSRDFGRDFIATKWGRGSVRIIGSVKGIEPISRSAYAFCHGDRGAVGRSRMPIARSRRTNTAP